MADHKAIWAELKQKLPIDKTEEQHELRKKMFHQFDPNSNGMLSVAEAHAGCAKFLGLEAITQDLQPICLRAHEHARGLRVHHTPSGEIKHTVDESYVTLCEFRVFLAYLFNYFELDIMFRDICGTGDRRISFDEFVRAVPLIESWGKKIEDPKATFDEITKKHGAMILFDDFCEWAIKYNIDADREHMLKVDLPAGISNAPHLYVHQHDVQVHGQTHGASVAHQNHA